MVIGDKSVEGSISQIFMHDNVLLKITRIFAQVLCGLCHGPEKRRHKFTNAKAAQEMLVLLTLGFSYLRLPAMSNNSKIKGF